MSKFLLLLFVLIMMSASTFAQNRTAEKIVRQQNSYHNYEAALKRSQDAEIETLKLAIKQKKGKTKQTPYQKKLARLKEELYGEAPNNN